MDLPVFEMVIDPQVTSDVEVAEIAFVDKPAIERNFLAFNAAREIKFAISEEKRIVSGPAMIANSLIFRKDEQGEYNVFFSKETIVQIALKFFKKGYQANLNMFHDPNQKVEGVTIFESFVSDESRGIQPMKGFEDLPDGTWFISAKVENEEVWQKIKSGEVRGFSVEGFFSYVTRKQNQETQLYQLLNATINPNGQFPETAIMSESKNIIEQLKEKFLGPANPNPAPAQNPAPAALAEYQLKDGTAVSITELAPGGVVMVGDVPAPMGEMELADGTRVMVGEGGVIQNVVAGQVAPVVQEDPYAKQFASYDEKFTQYEQKFAEQAQAFTTLSETVAQTNKTIDDLVAIIQKMAAEPTADPVTGGGNNFSTQKAQNKAEARKAWIEVFQKRQKK